VLASEWRNGSICNENCGQQLAPTSREQRALKVNPKNQMHYQKKISIEKL